MSARRWRPLLKQFYLRVHPDLLGKFGAARVENEASMKNLEQLMQTMPRNKTTLKFHVLCPRKESIERVVETSVSTPKSTKEWEESIDSVMSELLHGIVLPQYLEELLPQKKKSEKESEWGWLGSNSPQPRQSSKPVDVDHLFDLDLSGLEEIQREMEEEVKEMEKKQMRSEAGWETDVTENVQVEYLAKMLFQTGRVRCARNVDAFDAIEFIMEGLDAMDGSKRVLLLSPFFRDVTLLVRMGPTQLEGRILHVDIGLTPIQFATQIHQILDTFRNVHLHAAGLAKETAGA